ncbi:multidrug effflux MFS transporter [Dinoroseobacter sp. PD6]|uniref:multidrug effflux MFS transporter n=1 Tax=Dinoroseobacter sp. PD6 TaxID=3028384 RepID=UPI00237B0C6C|nr:multidrug effflux MFS transporter [Dinoroseobacter sp. PD6]MDD9718277.1 multidrug effflux MFS transporter [Dinoroseobacter sp. PD6]
MTKRPASRFLDRSTPPHLATLVLMAGVAALSMNVFLPSLPGMAVYFDAEYAVMQLSVSLYLMMTALLQLLVGPLSDRYGRRPVMLISTALFALATLGAIFAPTVEVFLACRMAQAVIASALVLSRAIVRDMVGQAEAASLIGYVTMGMAIVPMIGPALGGLLDETFGWRASFWLLFAAAVAMLWLIWSDLGETAPNRSGGFRAQVAEYPELLKARRFWGYVAAAAFASGVFFAFLGGAPYLGSEVFGLSPAILGVYFGAPALGYVLGNFLSGRFSIRIGINRMILWGSLITSVGMAASILIYAAGLTHPLSFFALTATVGIGNGMIIPNATAGSLSVRPHLAGTASGLGGAIMVGGGAAMSVLAGILLPLGTGPYPLQALMLLTSLGSTVAVIYVMRRERDLTAQPSA